MRLIAAFISLFAPSIACFGASSAITLHVPPSSRVGFTRLAPETSGLVFTNLLSDQGAAQNQIRYNGSGVALGDVDGDGLCDIFFCGLESPNTLYKNLGGLHFTNITTAAGLASAPHDCTGAVFADVDGDGDLDLLVNSIGGGSQLFLNDGAGKFTEALNNGLARRFGATSAAFGDIDGDGYLDLYVANYRSATIRSSGFALMRRGNETFVRPEDRDQLEITPEGRVLEKGEPDILYHNRGNGHFAPFSWTKGLFRDEQNHALTEPPRDWGLSVMFRDINGDGLPDLYVCNDFFTPDRIWINQSSNRGALGFRELAHDAIKATSTFSMTVDFADINRDSHDDIFVGDMLRRGHLGHALAESAGPMLAKPPGAKQDRPQLLRNTLQLNRGDGSYAEISQFAHLDASDWTWSAIFCDVDLDGYEDLLCATGQMFDTQDLDADARISAMGPWPRDKISQKVLQYPRLPMKNLAFRNRGDLTFEETSQIWNFNALSVANGMALADLDNDGDLDVVVNNLNGVAEIYRNDSAAARVAVRLKGRAPNTHGIGARILVCGSGLPNQSQEMICGGRYLSCDDTIRTFAAGSAAELTIEVLWRAGGHTIVEHVKPNTLQLIDEADGKPYQRTTSVPATPMFTDESDAIQNIHIDPVFDDFTRQPMLPHRLSALGPGVTWTDLNNDGREDLIIASGKTGVAQVLYNSGQGKFSPITNAFPAAIDDQTTILSWPTATNESIVAIARATYESGDTNSIQIFRLSENAAHLMQTLSLGESSPGPMCAADVDGDGDLDLFIGARILPGRYPAPANSWLFLNNNNTFTPAQQFSGLISGAVFSDLDIDGSPELLLACDWGPIQIFKWSGSQYVKQRYGLEQFVGRWNGITTADLNGDGLMDIIASNWGENTKFERFKNRLRLHYGNWSGDENFEMLESSWSPGANKQLPLRGLDFLKSGAPELAQKFHSHLAYARASVDEIIPSNQPFLEATYFKTTVFLNRSNRFEALPLPAEAQFAPSFGVAAADVDGDGIADIFLAQNFTDPDNDGFWNNSGQSLLLRGRGDGSFIPVPAAESGVRIAGNARGCSFGDYDNDGRIDLAVTQNRGPTKLFHNTAAKPATRLKLNGPPGNLTAVGAIVRPVNAGKVGPAQEVKLGSGYWSQSSATILLPPAVAVRVRWPNNKTTTNAIATDVRDATFNSPP